MINYMQCVSHSLIKENAAQLKKLFRSDKANMVVERYTLQIADQTVRGESSVIVPELITRQSLLSMAVKSLGMTSVAC